MNAGDLENEFRLLVDDSSDPPLWSSAEFLRWLNEAEVQACRRARLLVDSQNKTAPNNVCRITLATGTAFYAVDSRVIYIRKASLVGRSLPLEPVDYRDMDQCSPGWESHSGTIASYVRGLDTGKFRPYRIPAAANNGNFIDFVVVRQPLAEMAGPGDSPEINARYHRALLDWVCYRAYSKKDTETEDEGRALKHLATFEAEFGTREKASALEEEWQRNNLPYDYRDGTY